ncbi:Radial spoke head protein 9 [Lobulomyces angularis]|nr:Radial spoke head protein 9 [Lobulomyces angularis]
MSYLQFNDLAPFSLAGFTFNDEEKAALQSSLLVKKTEEKFDYITFWGKILGVNKDYYISQAWNDGECLDLVTWLQFPEVKIEDVPRLETISGRFLGEPGFEYPGEHISNLKIFKFFVVEAEVLPKEGDQSAEEIKPLNEEKRLATVIKLIDHDVHIVPRGAYYRDSLHNMMINNLNQGLASHELGELSSYLHFRPGYSVDMKLLMERGELFQEGIDIFEPISRDEPKGVWSIQVEKGGSIAILRSLLWPGYVFYHRPATSVNGCSQWGSVYYGNAQKNDNVGYML